MFNSKLPPLVMPSAYVRLGSWPMLPWPGLPSPASEQLIAPLSTEWLLLSVLTTQCAGGGGWFAITWATWVS